MADYTAARGPVRAENWVSSFLTDGSTIHAIGNYADAGLGLTQFKFAPTRKVAVHRMIAYIQDTGNFSVSTYGNGITLANGLRLLVRKADDSLIQAIDGGTPIQANADWSSLCYDINYHSFGVGDNALAVRWTFSRAGAPILIDGTLGEYLVMELNDDFSSLTDHTFCAQGIIA